MLKTSYLILPLLMLGACVNVSHVDDKSTKTQATTTNAPATTDGTVVQKPVAAPLAVNYRLVTSRDTIKHALKYFSTQQVPVLLAVNRVDSDHVAELKELLVPDTAVADINKYSPFPTSVPALQQVNKMLFFSYTAQYFAAYEHGQLVYTGPTNMGRQKDSTPTGLYYTNWKAEDTHSTFDDEWDLKWNVNIDNKAGIGFHQYSLPGYPASHSCLRLNAADAHQLYEWVDEWIYSKGVLEAQGDPVLVFGAYPFGQPKPWLQLATNPHALDITADQLQTLAQPHLDEIMKEQQKRTGMKKH